MYTYLMVGQRFFQRIGQRWDAMSWQGQPHLDAGNVGGGGSCSHCSGSCMFSAFSPATFNLASSCPVILSPDD